MTVTYSRVNELSATSSVSEITLEPGDAGSGLSPAKSEPMGNNDGRAKEERSASTAVVVFDGLLEGNCGPLLDRVLETPFIGGQVGQVSLRIVGEVRTRGLFELLQGNLVITVDPANRRVIDRLADTIDMVLVSQAGEDHVELQDTDGPEDKVAVPQRFEELDGPFLGELCQPLLQLLRPKGIAQPDPAEMFGGEIRNPREAEGFFFRKRVADLDRPVIMNADDVAGKRFLNVAAILGHEHRGLVDLDILAQAVMANPDAGGEFTGADSEKGDPVPVGRVHVGLDLKDEPGKLLFRGVHHAGGGLAG